MISYTLIDGKLEPVKSKKDRCSLCGKQFEQADYDNFIGINQIMYPPSKYAGKHIQMDICTDCADKVIDMVKEKYQKIKLADLVNKLYIDENSIALTSLSKTYLNLPPLFKEELSNQYSFISKTISKLEYDIIIPRRGMLNHLFHIPYALIKISDHEAIGFTVNHNYPRIIGDASLENINKIRDAVKFIRKHEKEIMNCWYSGWKIDFD